MDNKNTKIGVWCLKTLSCNIQESDSMGVELLKSYKVLYFGHASKGVILMLVQNTVPYNFSMHLRIISSIHT